MLQLLHWQSACGHSQHTQDTHATNGVFAVKDVAAHCLMLLCMKHEELIQQSDPVTPCHPRELVPLVLLLHFAVLCRCSQSCSKAGCQRRQSCCQLWVCLALALHMKTHSSTCSSSSGSNSSSSRNFVTGAGVSTDWQHSLQCMGALCAAG